MGKKINIEQEALASKLLKEVVILLDDINSEYEIRDYRFERLDVLDKDRTSLTIKFSNGSILYLSMMEGVVA